MEQAKKNTPNYATKLRNFEADETPEVWNGVASGVRKKLFFIFRWNYFNVYYLIVAISTVAIAVTLLFTNKAYTTNESAAIIDTIQTKDSAGYVLQQSDDYPMQDEAKAIVKNKEENNSTLPVNTKDIPAKDKAELQISPEPKTDSFQIVKSDIDSVKPVIKKPVVIRKRDTIVDIDTIKTYKKKRRR